MTQDVREVPVLVEDQDLLRRLRWAVDDLSTDEATAFAIAAGVRPPTDDPHWELLLRVAQDDTESLVWVLVLDSDDEN